MLVIALIGLGGGILYITLAWLMNQKAGKEAQAFAMLNSSGYNIYRNYNTEFFKVQRLSTLEKCTISALFFGIPQHLVFRFAFDPKKAVHKKVGICFQFR